jgi:hypothetical protein
METLRALAAEGGTASLTDQAQHKAHSALVAIEGITAHEIEADGGGGGERAQRHIMVSYQCEPPPAPHPLLLYIMWDTTVLVATSQSMAERACVYYAYTFDRVWSGRCTGDVQKTIERIVRSLQTIGYVVWFDLNDVSTSMQPSCRPPENHRVDLD